MSIAQQSATSALKRLGGGLVALVLALSMVPLSPAHATEIETSSATQLGVAEVDEGHSTFTPQEGSPVMKDTGDDKPLIPSDRVLYSDQITTVTFLDNKNISAGAIQWDMSAAQDGSVMAWATTANKNVTYRVSGSETTGPGYNLFIGAEGVYPSFGTSARQFFPSMSNLTKIDNLNKVSTSNVTDMRMMFAFCSNLTALDLSGFDTSKVEDMRYMFYGCSKLTKLNFSTFNTSNVTGMTAMFGGCSGLTSLDLSSFETPKLESVNSPLLGYTGMFGGCSNLTSLNLAKFDTTHVSESRYWESMFQSCSKLKTLTVGSNFKVPEGGSVGLEGNWKNTVTNDAYAAADIPFGTAATYERTDIPASTPDPQPSNPTTDPQPTKPDPQPTGPTTDPTTQPSTPANTPMYRLYNKWTQEHFYTSDEAERQGLIKKGWSNENIGWYAPKTGDPVYRLYNRWTNDHHYTLSAKERDACVKAGWRDEGIGWYSDPNQGVPLYREYNPWLDKAGSAGAHNYTTSKAEHDRLVKLGWRDERFAWYGVKG